jgi:hypothetical protein
MTKHVCVTKLVRSKGIPEIVKREIGHTIGCGRRLLFFSGNAHKKETREIAGIAPLRMTNKPLDMFQGVKGIDLFLKQERLVF